MSNLLQAFQAFGTFQTLTGIALLAVVIRLTILYFVTIRYPDNLPRVGEDAKATRFSLKSRLRYYTDSIGLFKEAHDRYSKHGKTCLIPGLGFRDEVILPITQLKWVASLSDDVLGTYEGFNEVDQAKWNFGGEYMVLDPWNGLVFKKEVTAATDAIVKNLVPEMAIAFDARLGSDTEKWKEVRVMDTVKLIVAQGSSSFTVSQPLARNEEYLRNQIRVADGYVIGAGLLGAPPRILKLFFSPLITIPYYYRLWKTKSHFEPEFNKRMELLKHPKSANEPLDHLQIMLRFAQRERPHELNLHEMSKRLSLSNFGSFHQTSLAMTNILFNIVASDPEYNTIALLREEFSRVLAANNGDWTKASISAMVRADSICRETLRIQSFGNRSMIRLVKDSNFRTPDGIHIPKGALVSFLAHPSQCDPDIYDQPLKFDPWRFSRLVEEEGRPAVKFTSTGPQFMPFGHGRHACPGRFLLDFELKIMMEYVVRCYDLRFPKEYNGVRPESKWMAEAIFPPAEAKIEFKRRV